MLKIATALGAFFLFFQSGSLWAESDINVSATVDRNEVGVGDLITLTISVSSGSSISIEDHRLPSLSPFREVQRSTGSETRSVFEGGQFQVLRTQQFNYRIEATREGEFTLGAAEVLINGESYYTQPITINVSDRAASTGRRSPQQPQTDPFQEMDEMFNQLLQRRMGRHAEPRGRAFGQVDPQEAYFIQVEVDKTDAFIGEQVTASWYLVTRAQIVDIDTLKYPELTGFWKEDIEIATRLNFRQEIINGIPYQKARLISYALFPMRAGELIIDDYKSKCTVVGISSMGLSQRQEVTKSSELVPIQVRQLPEQGKPASFTGGVGRYQFSARLDRTSGKANEPITLTMRVEGRGNAKLIEKPPLNLPDGIEAYEPRVEAEFRPNGTSNKEFEILLIPRKEGEFIIPPIEFSYFDPSSRTYKTEHSQSFTLNIAPGDTPDLPSLAMREGGGGGSDPGPLTLPPLSLEYKAGSAWSQNLNWIVWSLAYSLAFAILIWRYFVEFGLGKKRESLRKLVKARLSKIYAKQAQGDWRAVGIETSNTIYFILGELSEEGSSFEFEKLLEKAPPSFRREVAEPLKVLIKELEVLSYAPEASVGKLKEPGTLKTIISRAEKILYKALDYDKELEEVGQLKVRTT